MELRKLISYRVDFWAQFVGSIFFTFLVSYFLWSSIFEFRGVDTIGGYTFEMMMVYYILAALFEKNTLGDAWTNLSGEIYDGTLTRYIIYPMPVLPYKYIAHLAKTTIALLQTVLTISVLALIFETPAALQVTPFQIVQTLVVMLFAGYLFFIMNICVEMVAFWADSVWSLMVMLKFTVSLLGGAYLPLTLFPDKFRMLLELLPFSYFISFPIRCFMGRVGVNEWLSGLAIIIVWSLLFTALSQLIWRRGSMNYAGVGQ